MMHQMYVACKGWVRVRVSCEVQIFKDRWVRIDSFNVILTVLVSVDILLTITSIYIAESLGPKHHSYSPLPNMLFSNTHTITIATLFAACAASQPPHLKPNGWQLTMYADANYNAASPRGLPVDTWHGVIPAPEKSLPKGPCLHLRTMKRAYSLRFWSRNVDRDTYVMLEFFAGGGCKEPGYLDPASWNDTTKWYEKDLSGWYEKQFGKGKTPGSFQVTRLDRM
ncbi:hypothetical protein BJ138DRAFT_864630 [Hygrophoropsis aurantiaca]|uniref:Uncharacterized protein n=1 Tax=Hygrophoropsis aurantiaca TaxID=72124 RepID=A0ACB7ZVB1_9AGAM|nr:hypothetical protein BJ138DRAFT_864630 [Hygrophoropsis aurantiaca]